MSEHYFTREPTSKHDIRRYEATVSGVRAEFYTDAGTFSRDGLDTGTHALITAMPPLRGRVLDLGSGVGPVGVFAGLMYPQAEIVMADINSRAVSLARENAEANGVRAVVIQSDGFECVPGKFDFILTNPPIRAGKAKIYSLFKDSLDRLAPGGELIIVMRVSQGVKSAVKYLESLGAVVTTIGREAGYHVVKAAVR